MLDGERLEGLMADMPDKGCGKVPSSMHRELLQPAQPLQKALKSLLQERQETGAAFRHTALD